MKFILLLGLFLKIVSWDCWSQARFSADSYLATPEKYLGKSVTVYVDSVNVPAINCTTDDPFRVFRIYTKGRNANEYVGGGSIYVKVPRSEADSFVKRHNNPNKMAPANLSGVLREWPTKWNDRSLQKDSSQEHVWWTECYSYSHFYLDCTK